VDRHGDADIAPQFHSEEGVKMVPGILIFILCVLGGALGAAGVVFGLILQESPILQQTILPGLMNSQWIPEFNHDQAADLATIIAAIVAIAALIFTWRQVRQTRLQSSLHY
jgi:hypothetical protein